MIVFLDAELPSKRVRWHMDQDHSLLTFVHDRIVHDRILRVQHTVRCGVWDIPFEVLPLTIHIEYLGGPSFHPLYSYFLASGPSFHIDLGGRTGFES
jgi:hypothetical protein